MISDLRLLFALFANTDFACGGMQSLYFLSFLSLLFVEYSVSMSLHGLGVWGGESPNGFLSSFALEITFLMREGRSLFAWNGMNISG